MGVLVSLYDTRNEKYPICYSGILTFIITTFLPLNLGITKLPVIDVVVLLLAGFASLFMLTRNEKVGLGLLNHLRIKERKNYFDQTRLAAQSSIDIDGHTKYEESKQDQFILLQNVVERIIITHDEHLDSASRVKLEDMHQRIQKITKRICKLEACS